MGPVCLQLFLCTNALLRTRSVPSDSRIPFQATKVGAIVGGQTSCKAPELAAFERHLPSDVEIVSCHSLHGPKVNPKGQPLVGLYLYTLVEFDSSPVQHE